MFIGGERADLRQEHIEMEERFGAKICGVCYDTEVLKKDILKVGDFEKYFYDHCELVNKLAIRVVWLKGLLS